MGETPVSESAANEGIIVSPRYGQGLTYSLALFLAHEGNFRYCLSEIEAMATEGAIKFDGKVLDDKNHISLTLSRLAAVRWFTQAVDPLRNLVIDVKLPDGLKERMAKLKAQCLDWSLPQVGDTHPTKYDVNWAIEETKELLRLIDEHHGIQTSRESHEAKVKRSPCLVYSD